MNKQEIELIKQYNETKDKTLLKNKGMRTENTIFNKKVKIGYDGSDPIYLECKIKKIDHSTEAIYKYNKDTKDYDLIQLSNTKKDIYLNDIQEYYTVSFSANSRNFGGQCYDIILDDDSLKIIDKEQVKRIIELWKKYHLNNLNAGCVEQTAAVEEFKKSNKYDYNAVCEYLKKKNLHSIGGYEYGTKWLINPLSEKDILLIIETINKYGG
jgi:hypothetical protein